MSNNTVLVTGASGFIAKHIVVQLLDAGYHVRGSVRNIARADEIRAVAKAKCKEPAQLDDRLQFAILDLDEDAGWSKALQGVDALMHTASPFPLEQPKNEDDVIRPAVDGTLRALRAAKAHGVHRVVMTSSLLSIMLAPKPADRAVLDERDWTDVKSPRATPYAKSKTQAERAAWEFVRQEAPQIAPTAINPAFVLGTPLDRHIGTSLKVIQRLLKGKDPMLPNFGFPVADVEDIAIMHVRALQRPASIGQRYIGGDEFLWFPQMAAILKDVHPDRRFAIRKAPDIVIRLLGLFDKEIGTIVDSLGVRDDVSARRARDDLEITFRPAADSVRATGRFLIDNALV